MSTTKLSGVKPPPALVLSSNKCENWKLWKQQWNNYVILSKLDKMEATVTVQLAMLENCLGSDGLKICNSLTFGTDETKDMKAVIMKLEETFIGELNETYERYMFNLRKQQSGESIDDYVTDLRNLAKSCKFCDCLGESLLRDRIVMGVRDLETRKKLLEIKNLKLSACIDLCRSIEATNTQLASVSDMKEVHKIKTKFSGKTDYKNGKADFTCHFCCKKHKMQKSLCPAWGQTCSKCKQKNHFAASAKCPSKNIHKLDVIEMKSDSDMALVHVVKNNNSPSTLFGTIVVNNQQIKAQIDTGAAVNVLPAKYVSSGDIKQTETVLQMYNNSTFKPLGESRVTVYNPANGHTYKIKFIIVPDCAGMIPVLGLKACKFMEIVTINDNNLQPVMSVKTCSITDDYADVFDNKLGKLPGKAHFQVNPDICPVVSPVRRIPISLKAKVKAELDNLTDQNVITPIQDPTDWVSNLVVTMKKNGDLRVCLDPQCLNKALKREHFRLPVLDDILPELSNAKLFSTLDVKMSCLVFQCILKKPLYRAPKRLQAMMMRLQRYDLIISYVSGKLLYLADTLSRAFSPDGNTVSAQSNLERVCMIQSLPMTEHRILEIKKATESDDEMKLLKSIIINGWPGDKLQLPPEVLPYFSIRDELSVQDGIIFRGERAVIPAELRNVLKEKIHSSHLGIEGCLRRAREAIYWPNMNADMKDYISKCSVCRSTSDCQQKETMMPHDIPDRPWAKVGVDLFSLNNRDYLITVDYYSNFWEVDNLSSTESISVIRKLKAHFARYGIPDVVMSDNGPQFSSERFAKFAETWEFQHDTSSPGHSQSNGKAESAVKTAKKLMKRAELSKSEIYLSFLDHRNTPNDSGYSPAQCLMNRRTKTLLPVTSNLLKPEISVNRHRSLCVSQQRQKSYYDKHSKDLRSLEEGDVVRMKPFHGQQWKKATVCKRLADRSYRVETSDGGAYTRNRVHLRKTTEQPTSSAGSTHLDQPISVVPTIESSHGSNDAPTSQTSATEESAAQERYVTRSGRVVKPVERYE